MYDPLQLAAMFKCLSVDTRLRIVHLLHGRTLCVGALAARLGVTPAAVSQHLRILREADLVVSEKRGYFVHYRLNRDTLIRWLNRIRPLFEAEDRLLPCVDFQLPPKGDSHG